MAKGEVWALCPGDNGTVRGRFGEKARVRRWSESLGRGGEAGSESVRDDDEAWDVGGVG